MPKTDFSPLTNGYHFTNYFENQVANLPGIGKIETYGRCGGMAFSALDCYRAGVKLPGYTSSDFGKPGVPPDGTALADYIFHRQLDSFLTLTAVKFVTWTLAPDAGNFLVKGVTRRTKEDEFAKLRDSVDRDVPVPIGLIVARDLNSLGHNHQVVAYGYDYDAASQKQTVYIYDVNWPNQEITLVSGPNDAGWAESSPGKEQWRGWFVQDYAPHQPPPDLTAGITAVIASAASAVAGAAAGAAKTIGAAVDAVTPEPVKQLLHPAALTVTLKQLAFSNEDEPDAAGDLAFEFKINGQTVRWPARGTRSIQHGTTASINKAVKVSVQPSDTLVISGAIASNVNLIQTPDISAQDYRNLDSEAQSGQFQEAFTAANNWGKGDHTVTSDGNAGGYTLTYSIA